MAVKDNIVHLTNYIEGCDALLLTSLYERGGLILSKKPWLAIAR